MGLNSSEKPKKVSPDDGDNSQEVDRQILNERLHTVPHHTTRTLLELHDCRIELYSIPFGFILMVELVCRGVQQFIMGGIASDYFNYFQST